MTSLDRVTTPNQGPSWKARFGIAAVIVVLYAALLGGAYLYGWNDVVSTSEAEAERAGTEEDPELKALRAKVLDENKVIEKRIRAAEVEKEKLRAKHQAERPKARLERAKHRLGELRTIEANRGQ